MHSNNQYDQLPTIGVQPLKWDEWNTYGTSCWSGTSHHYLSNMGKTSNGYTYQVTTKPDYSKYSVKILKVVLRPTCCKGKGRCPIGKEVIPDHPCREHLRGEAERMAYEAWVQYLTALAGKY